MIEVIFNIFMFVFILVMSVGLGWLSIQRYAKHFSRIELFIITIISGVVIWSLSVYVASSMHIRSISILLIAVFSLIGWIKLGKTFKKKNNLIKVDVMLLVIVLLGVVGQLFLIAPSGLIYNDGMRMYGVNAHDGMWHVALMQTLQEEFPPIMPTFARAKLSGYHFMIDLWGSELSRVFGLSPFWLVFRSLPLIFSIVTGLGIYSIVLRSTKSKLAALTGTFLNYFAGSFAFLLPIIMPGSNWSESTFWAQQSITTFINLPLGASYAVMVVIFIIVLVWMKKPTLHMLIWLAAIMTGVLVSFKAYTGILVAMGFIAMLGIYGLSKKAYWVIGPILTVGTLFLIFTLPQLTNDSGLVFEPGWYLKTMMEAPDRLGYPIWELKRQTYLYQENTFRLIELWIKAFLIYLAGNMGVRILGFGILRKKWITNHIYIFTLLAVSAMAGILIPLLFIQKGIVWNTIQFFYVSLFVFNIYTAIVIGLIKNKSLQMFVVSICLVVTIPTTLKTLGQYRDMYNSPNSYQLINSDELDVLLSLADMNRGIVLAPYNNHAYVSGISGQLTYYADDTQAILIGLNSDERKSEVNKIYCGQIEPENLKVFLADKNIKYIYMTDSNNSDCRDDHFDELPYLTKLIDRVSATLYKYD